MLSVVKIKEEPADEMEDFQEIFRQEVIVKQEISDELSNQYLPSNNFHIVEEQDSIITVSAADMRSEDEKRFIDSINNTDPNKFVGMCSKCLKSFTNRTQFQKHIKRNHCLTKQMCPVCPVTFIDATSLLNHLNLHRENIFFCSHYCGANFPTLPLCEEHELKDHKIQASPKIRFKYFCSFCREGFKTELQLHVHWLQQTQGCGKLRQDVFLHSSNVDKNCDNNIKDAKNPSFDPQLQSATANSISIIPITKLRLKYASTTTREQATNKRQNDNNESIETTAKRLKSFDKLKAETESDQFPQFKFEADIQIKEEPADDYESAITASLIPEVIIKTEEEDKTEVIEKISEKPAMTSLLINNMIGPESNGKFIPIENFVSLSENAKVETKPEMKTYSINNLVKSNVNGKIINMNGQNLPILKIVNNNNNNKYNISANKTENSNAPKKNESSLRFVKIAPKPVTNNTLGALNFANVKNFTTGKLVPVKLANGPNVSNGDIKPLPKSGLQIIKFLPNTQVMTIKTNNINNNKNSSLLTTKEPVFIKLNTVPAIAGTATNFKANSSPRPSLKNTTVPTTKACSSPSTSPNTSMSPTLSIKLNSLEQNTTIDSEDFKKLQMEALIKAEEHRKNFYISKTRLMIIEKIPEKKQLIDSMKQQIAEVETKTTEQIQGKPGGNFVLKPKETDEPSSLYLPILTTMDVPLVQARYQNPNYNYKWICPYCLKDYEIKTALKMHLIKAHNLNNRDMEKINVQAKPFVYEEEPIQDIKPKIKEEPLSNDTDSQSLAATSETESFIIDNVLSSSPKSFNKATNITQRSRYVCHKCGRTCSSKTMLSDHISANCSREPQYSCKECEKKFFSHGTLQCHMTIHTGELPHKCNYCDKRFRTRGQVKVHHRTHTGERPFFCQVCSQRFTHRETLIAHLSRHIGMKRYKCYGCDKHFSCISALKTHRDLRADTCGKVKFNPRAIGPRVRVIRGNVIFEPQPEINPYLKSEDPKSVLSELQNQSSSLHTSQ